MVRSIVSPERLQNLFGGNQLSTISFGKRQQQFRLGCRIQLEALILFPGENRHNRAIGKRLPFQHDLTRHDSSGGTFIAGRFYSRRDQRGAPLIPRRLVVRLSRHIAGHREPGRCDAGAGTSALIRDDVTRCVVRFAYHLLTAEKCERIVAAEGN